MSMELVKRSPVDDIFISLLLLLLLMMKSMIMMLMLKVL